MLKRVTVSLTDLSNLIHSVWNDLASGMDMSKRRIFLSTEAPLFDPKEISWIYFDHWKRIITVFFGDMGRLLGTFKCVVGGGGRVTHDFKSLRSPYIFCGTKLLNYFGYCLHVWLKQSEYPLYKLFTIRSIFKC